MKIKCPYCKKDITTNNTFSGGMVFCDFCNHNFFLQIKRSAFPHFLLYTILFVVCILLGYNCIKWNQRYNGFLADEKTKEDIWGAEKEQLKKRIESIVAERKEELDNLYKTIATHEITIQQQTEKESLNNSNYQKTIEDLESTRDKLLVENKNLLSENEQLKKQQGNAKQEKPTQSASGNKPESSPSRIIKTPFGTTSVYGNNDTQSEGASRTPSTTISLQKNNPKENEVSVELPNGQKLTLVKVEAGTFEMSAKDGQNRSGEVPHRVTLKRDFYIGQTEVTQAQWKAVMGANPSKFKGDELPVEQVNWSDTKEFCEKLNDLYAGKLPVGFKFTLPTETQWEYASRGGKKSKGFVYSGSNSINEVAWYMGNSDHKTHPVAQKKANELGLYDMSGNVDEWCLDDWVRDSNKLTPEFTRGNDGSDSSRMRRGGSWNASDFNCRSADRGSNIPTNPNDRFHALGFRLALVPIQ